MKQILRISAALVIFASGCASVEPEITGPKWKPIGQRKARVVHWGIIHNHSKGKWDAVRLLKDDFELVGWVDDRKSKAMRMQEPNVNVYTNLPCFTPQQVFDEVKPDLIVVETANSDLVEISTEIAKHGIPMHMDKPLGVDQEGYAKMSAICEARGIPLQIGYMFRSNEAINKMVELARDGILGEIYSIEADLDHNYGYPKYPEYASHYPGGTAYLLTCHAIEWAMPIFNDEMPLKTWSIIKPAPGDPEWAKTHSLTVMEYPRAIPYSGKPSPVTRMNLSGGLFLSTASFVSWELLKLNVLTISTPLTKSRWYFLLLSVESVNSTGLLLGM